MADIGGVALVGFVEFFEFKYSLISIAGLEAYGFVAVHFDWADYDISSLDDSRLQCHWLAAIVNWLLRIARISFRSI